MTIVVAFTAQDSGTSALELASVLSRSTGEPLVVTVVVTTPHAAGAPEFVDGDYLGPLTDWGQSVLDQARGAVPPGDRGDLRGARRPRRSPAGCSTGRRRRCVRHRARLVEQGALGPDLLRQRHGPARALGPPAGAARPARLPRRDRASHPPGQHRLRGIERTWRTWPPWAPGSPRRWVRACGPCRSPSGLPSGSTAAVEESADDLVVDRWVDAHEGLPFAPRSGTATPSWLSGSPDPWSSARASRGARPSASVEWSDGDLLVIGPSSSAPAARLFLGSRASKIVRSAPVPVLMVPAPHSS